MNQMFMNSQQNPSRNYNQESPYQLPNSNMNYNNQRGNGNLDNLSMENNPSTNLSKTKSQRSGFENPQNVIFIRIKII